MNEGDARRFMHWHWLAFLIIEKYMLQVSLAMTPRINLLVKLGDSSHLQAHCTTIRISSSPTGPSRSDDRRWWSDDGGRGQSRGQPWNNELRRQENAETLEAHWAQQPEIGWWAGCCCCCCCWWWNPPDTTTIGFASAFANALSELHEHPSLPQTTSGLPWSYQVVTAAQCEE